MAKAPCERFAPRFDLGAVGRFAERWRPHDQRIFVVVTVVTLASAVGGKSILSVERLRRGIRHPDLERQPVRPASDRFVEHKEEQKLTQTMAPMCRVDADRGHVCLVEGQPHSREADDGGWFSPVAVLLSTAPNG
jgi:hypothetical protein